MTTYSGRHINPLQLQPTDVDIRDIAHSLACTNRFGGHAERPINVAQHSVFVSRLVRDCGKNAELWGLLHDAAEAYIGDVTKWIKQTDLFQGYRDLEEKIETVITYVFSVQPILQDLQWVEEADKLMVRFEATKAYGKDYVINSLGATDKYPALSQDEYYRIGPWTYWGWKESEKIFLDTYERIIRR